MIMAPSMTPPVMEAWSKTRADETRARERESQAQINSARAREMTGKGQREVHCRCRIRHRSLGWSRSLVTLDLHVSQQAKKHLGWLHEPHHHQSSPG